MFDRLTRALAKFGGVPTRAGLDMLTLKQAAGWRNLKVVSTATVSLGLISDFLTPLVNVAGWALFLFAILMVIGAAGYWVCNRYPRHLSRRKYWARTSLVGVSGVVVFAFISGAGAVAVRWCPTGLTACTFKPADTLQQDLFPDEVRIATLRMQEDVAAISERTGAIAEETRKTRQETSRAADAVEASARATEQVRDQVGMGREALENIGQSMDTTVALTTLDRAVSSKSPSMQGQDRAVQALLAEGYSFTGTDYSGLFLRNAEIPGIEFAESNLAGADFGNAVLVGGSFRDTELEFASFSGADATRADFSGSLLAYAVAGDGSNFQEANFARANAFAMNLRGADLRRSTWRGASLVMADLRDADLRGADLTNATLFGAVLTGAKLDGTIFANTDIGSAFGIDPGLGLAAPAICARQAGPHLVMQLRIIEAIPSSRYESGYSYEQLNTHGIHPFVPVGSQFDNKLCDEVPAGEFVRVNPPVSGIHMSRDHMWMRLPHALLRAGNRRRKYMQRIEEHSKFVKETVKEEGFLRPGTSRLEHIVDSINRATRELKVPTYDCFDGDTANLLLTARALPGGAEPHFSASARHDVEVRKRAFATGTADTSSGKTVLVSFPVRSPLRSDGAPSWGFVFPDGVPADDVGGAVEEAFRRWNTRRLELIGDAVTLCLGGPETDSMWLYRSRTIVDRALVAQSKAPSDYLALSVYGPPYSSWAFQLAGQLSQENTELLLSETARRRGRSGLESGERLEIDLSISGVDAVQTDNGWVYLVSSSVVDVRRRRLEK